MSNASPEFTVRSYQPSDRDQVEKILAEGMGDTRNGVFKRSLVEPRRLIVQCFLFLTAFSWSHNLAACAICWLAYALGLFCISKIATRQFVSKSIMDDRVREFNGIWSEPSNFFLVAVLKDRPTEVLGMAAGTSMNGLDKTVELSRMFVKRGVRGLGIGQVLLLEFLQNSRRLGYETCLLVTTSVQAPAQKLYEKFGFRLHQKTRHPLIISDLLFRWAGVERLLFRLDLVQNQN